MNENFQIRLAKYSDIERLTDLHCKSFRKEDHVPMMLGRNYVRATYKWQIRSDSAYVLIAERDTLIIGLVAVCDGSFTKDMFIACLPEFILTILSNPTLLLRKLLWKRLRRSQGTNKSNDKLFNLKGFAQMTIGVVENEYRGKGVFGQLIHATIDYSKERGSKAIRAGIYKKNDASRWVFIKAGWTEVPALETIETVFYVAFLDDNFSRNFLFENKEAKEL